MSYYKVYEQISHYQSDNNELPDSILMLVTIQRKGTVDTAKERYSRYGKGKVQ